MTWSSEMPKWKRFKIWDEWKCVTQMFGCVLTAMEREAERTRLLGPKAQLVKRGSGMSKFTASPQEYAGTLENVNLFCGMVLQASFGLIEQHCRDVLRQLHGVGVDVTPVLRPESSDVSERIEYFPPPNGIEDWGAKLLGLVHRGWADVKPGRAGIVEVAVVRSAMAHGTPVVTNRMLNRLANVVGSIPWAEGMTIELTFDLVKDYRDRLRSFARVLSDATAKLLPAHEADQKNPKKVEKPKSRKSKR